MSGEPALTERNKRLFLGLVMEKAELAFMFMGRRRRPDGRTVPVDLEAARVCIDTLEMLEEKTRGNLSKEEQEFLQAMLDELRLTYVEVVTQQEHQPAPQAPVQQTDAADHGQADAPGQSTPTSQQEQSTDETSRRRFFKSYGP